MKLSGVSRQARYKVWFLNRPLNASLLNISPGNQEDGAAYKANPGDRVTYHCKLGAQWCVIGVLS